MAHKSHLVAIKPQTPSKPSNAQSIAMRSIAVIYPYIPHYRAAVFAELTRTFDKDKLYIYAGNNTIDPSIKEAVTDELNLRHIRTITFYGITMQLGLLGVCIKREAKCLIFLGDPHIATTWIYALIAKFTGKKVLFWTHGWLSDKSGPKEWIRKAFYKLADGLLLYGNRAKEIGVKNGFNPKTLFPIYNSLDYAAQLSTLKKIQSNTQFSSQFIPTDLNRDKIYFACVARLTKLCQFNIAISALSILRQKHKLDIPLVLIGSGPEENNLRSLAAREHVTVHFLGEQYSEDVIGSIIFGSRAVVSPGKVGLTAMHSLAYGTPVITHGEFSTQMPEFEAITPGSTGDFFEKDNPEDLANTLIRWYHKPKTLDERSSCIQIIEEKYNPSTQARLIKEAVQAL